MSSTRLFAFAALLALPLGTTAAVAAPASPGVAKSGSGIEHRSVIQVQNRGGGGRAGGGAAMRGGGGPGGSAMRGGGRPGGGSGMRAGRSSGGPVVRGGGGGPRVGMRGGGRQAYRGRGPGRGYANYRGRHSGYRHRGHRHHGHRHFRGRYFYGYPYFYDWGPSYYDDYYYDDGAVYDTDADYAADDVARCAARYRSFDPATGTFLHNDGYRKLCPYLAS